MGLKEPHLDDVRRQVTPTGGARQDRFVVLRNRWVSQQYPVAFSPYYREETLLPFASKWQPNIATTFHCRKTLEGV